MECRFCKTKVVHTFIDLGTSPPSNSFLKKDDLNYEEVYFPLKVSVCHRCLLVQLDEYKSNKEIFNDEYVYFSSYSQSWLKHARDYVEMIIGKFGISEKSRVIEIASNDGYLLQNFVKSGIPCLGIEPTANTAAIAIEKGIDTIVDFFNVNLANKLSNDGLKADLIIGNNVLAHDPNLNELVKSLKITLKETGGVTMEFPHLLNLIEYNQFDTIYHEHFSYFSLYSVIRIFEYHGMEIFDVEEIPTHGGSLRIYAKHAGIKLHKVSDSVSEVLKKESLAGLHSITGYKEFQVKALDCKMEFLNFLLKCRYKNKKVVGYGAAAKGNTLLNYCGVKDDMISFVTDASEHKQGKFMPGSRIEVSDEARLRAFKPDYVIIFPWNIKDEIMDQLDYIAEWGRKVCDTDTKTRDNMRRVLVTGATGFLGNHVINCLLNYNCKITATSVEPPNEVKHRTWFKHVNYVSFDLNNEVKNYFQYFGDPDILIHLAWEGLPKYNESHHLEKNLPNSYRLIENMISNGLNNVLVAGTCFEYGMVEGCLSEDIEAKPENNYAKAKDTLRKEIEDLKKAHTFKFTWPRIFYIYGPGQSPGSLFGQLNKAIDSKEKVFNMSPGDQVRDFIEVEKAAEIIAKLALNNKNNGIVNCCSGVPVSVLEFVKIYLQSVNYKINLNAGYYDYSKFEPMNFWGNTSKLESIIL